MAPRFSKSEVRDILLRLSTNGLTHGQNFYNCVAMGDSDFTEQYSNDPTLLNRAKAEIRNSKILYHVRQLMLEDTESYQFVEDANSFYVRVAGCLHVRFKKLDGHGRSAQGKTRRDILYRMQDGGCLPFLDQVSLSVNLDVGYTLGSTGLMSGISFSCCAPLSIGVHWTLPAKDLDITEAQQSLFAIPAQEIIPVLQLDLKEHLKKNNDERQAASDI